MCNIVYIIGVYIIGVYIISVYIIGVYIIGAYIIGAYIIGVKCGLRQKMRNKRYRTLISQVAVTLPE